MSIEFTQRETDLRRRLTAELNDEIKNHIESEINEQAEEIKNDLEYEYPEVISRRLPNAEQVISRDESGSFMSHFCHSDWKFRHEDGTLITIRFGQNHQEYGFDLSDPLSDPLRTFEKILSFYDIPANDRARKPLKPGSIASRAKQNLHFLSYLHSKGFLRGKDPKGLNQINVDDLRHEIYLRIKQDEGVSRVLHFTSAISRWVRISQRVALPEEFAANFTLIQFLAGGLNKDIAHYVAPKKGRWQAIIFDELLVMINMSQTYIQNYSKDLIFIERIFEEAYQRRVKAGLTYPITSFWLNEKATKDLEDNLLNHQFSNDENNEPWLTIKKATYKRRETQAGTQYILKSPIIDEWLNLMGATIFMLLIWSAMRCNELRNLKADALRVDGKPLDLNRDTIEQVQGGSRFDLRRTVFKTSGEPGGKDFILPLPKIGAIAFATLVDIFRGTRKRQQTLFLLPSGGFDIHGAGFPGERGSDSPVGNKTIQRWLLSFCDTVGVEHHYPHQCRKTLATLLINHDPNSLELIRKLLCHDNITMTLEYITDLPGVGEEINMHMMESMREKIIDFIAYGAKGQVAGGAGDRLLDAISASPKAYKGDRLPTTTQMLLNSLEAANFTIQRTPAAWCIRFPTSIPKNAPCFHPAIQEAIEAGSMEAGIDVFPSPEYCKPWICGDAAHTPREIGLVKRSLSYAKKRVKEGGRGQSDDFYIKQVEYWESVLNQLENGRSDIVGLNIIESVLGQAG